MGEATIESNLVEFVQAVKAYGDKLGYNVGKVLKWQAGFLARDLIDYTPLAAAANIRRDVNAKFKALNAHHETSLGEADSKSGHGDIRWYSSDSSNLYGVDRNSDMTGATDQAIYENYFKIKLSRNGMVRLGKRGRQSVNVWKQILTTAEQAKRLADRLVNHSGRLAAGWSVAWFDCGSPGRALPAKVARHAGRANGARGYSIDDTGIPLTPSFTIVNTAKGGENFMKGKKTFINYALLRRIRKMRVHVLDLLRNPEHAARTVSPEVMSE